MATIKPKRSLGQNFLRDIAVLDRIIESANLSKGDLVIEVGPGEGVLSIELAKRVNKLIMVEKDEELAKKTATNFKFKISNDKSNPNDKNLNPKSNATIIIGDILEINLPELIEVETQHRCVSKNVNTKTQQCCVSTDIDNYQYKVIANIPYYITSPIIRLFLETKYPPTEMLLMVQKEVAERICAKAGKLSILALSVQYYATPELLFTVPRAAFFPVPEVDSAVIRITRNERPACAKTSTGETKKFFKLVKAGFSAKRKTLVNNLSSSLQLEKAIIEEKLKQIGISPKQRAQELQLEDWKNLTKSL
ncbi:MAG: 16S rRNA (adenine(1518)-N(6)/adenine(1519)-N(6))-dimethyltransferase RsmA [Candidatus Moraniibacteriota bacterium]